MSAERENEIERIRAWRDTAAAHAKAKSSDIHARWRDVDALVRRAAGPTEGDTQ